MNDRLHAGMREASRLTRAGRLIDATALLQRGLQSRRGPDPDASNAVVPSTIDLVPEACRGNQCRAQPAGEEQSGRGCPTCFTVSSDRGTRSGFAPGRDGLAEPSAADVPESESGQFLTKSFSNQAGTRAYKLYVPSQYRGQPLPFDRHAARLYPVARRLRRRHADKSARRGVQLLCCLSRAGGFGQYLQVLELVSSGRSDPRPGRAGADCGPHAPDHEQDFRWTKSASTPPGSRPAGGCRGPGGGLSRPLCGNRRAFRPRLRSGRRPSLGLRGNAPEWADCEAQ